MSSLEDLLLSWKCFLLQLVISMVLKQREENSDSMRRMYRIMYMPSLDVMDH